MKNGVKVLGVVAVVALFGLRIGLLVMRSSEPDRMPEPNWEEIGKIAAEDFMKQQQSEADPQVSQVQAYLKLLERLDKQHENDAARIWVQAQSAGLVSERGTVYAVTKSPKPSGRGPNQYGKPQLVKPTAGRYMQVTRDKEGRIDYRFHNAGKSKTPAVPRSAK